MRIVFEGLPGAGKTSHVQQLASAFALPLVPEWICFTDKQWRSYALCKPFYFANDEVKEFIGRFFTSPVLFDRHYTGALAYGYALSQVHGPDPLTGESYEENLSWYKHCLAQNRLCQPACVFILDISPDTSLRRQPRAQAFDPIFGDRACLEAMRTYYHIFYTQIEPEVQVFWVDGEGAKTAVYQTLHQHLTAILANDSTHHAP